jgi:hypothetical protein
MWASLNAAKQAAVQAAANASKAFSLDEPEPNGDAASPEARSTGTITDKIRHEV